MRKCKVCNQDKPIQELYRCINCKIDLCKDCKTDHDKNHEILDYNQKKFICESHKNPYSNYCFTCKLILFCGSSFNISIIVSKLLNKAQNSESVTFVNVLECRYVFIFSNFLIFLIFIIILF